MFEGFASWILETYIGKYINVSPDKLSIGLLSGVIELDNVQLKPEAFNNESPFEFKFGFVGKIKFNLALSALRYSPWMLIAENLCLIIGPKKLPTPPNSNETQDAEIKKTAEEILKEKLANQEAKWLKEVELMALNESGDNETKNNSILIPFLGSIAYSILKNLHVNLKNLHVIYEDEYNECSFVANIDSILIKNENKLQDNEDFKENFPFNENLAEIVTKTCEIKNFSTYFDTNLIYGENKTNEQILSAISELLTLKSQNESLLVNYMLRPTSFKAFLIQDISPKPLRKRKKPRIRIAAMLKEFNLIIDQKHVKHLTSILEFSNVYENKAICHKIKRPEKFSAKDWWKYLLQCVTVLTRKVTRKDLVKWSQDVNSYRKIYEKSLNLRLTSTYASNSELSNLNETSNHLESEETRQVEKRIESEWDFKRISILRRVIFENLTNGSSFKALLLEKSAKNAQYNNNYYSYRYLSWFGSIKNYYFGKIPQEKLNNELLNEQQEHNKIDDEVLGLINDSIENESLFRRDSLLAVLEFKIEAFNILLSSSLSTNKEAFKDQQKIAEIKFEESKFLFEALPRYDSYLFEMNMESFYLFDCSTKRNSFPILIYPRFDKKLKSLNYFDKLNEQQPSLNGNENFYLSNLISTHSNGKKVEDQTVFKLVYEHKPLNQQINMINQSNMSISKNHSANLIIKSCGLDVIYNLKLFEKLKDFMVRINEYYQTSSSFSSILKRKKQSTNNDYLDKMKSQFYKDLLLLDINNEIHDDEEKMKMLNKLKLSPSFLHRITLDFEITAPKLIIPIDIYSKNTDVVIFDFGRLSFANKKSSNDPVKSKPSQDATIQTNLVEQEAEDSDEDDVYETPTATPPNELLQFLEANESSTINNFSSLKHEFYSNFDLNFNELQVICGKLHTDNLKFYINKGHSRYHLLEKFDINIQVKLSKIKMSELVFNIGNDGEESLTSEDWPFLKIDINLDLLKLNIDDFKLLSYYKALESVQKLLHTKHDVRNETEEDDVQETVKNAHTETNSSEINSENFNEEYFKYTKKNFIIPKLLKFNLKLNELNMTLSIVKTNEENEQHVADHSISKLNQLKSLCELKIYSINSNLTIDYNWDIGLKLRIFNLLLIDARQIYGSDYQLLAASHNNVVLDSKTGQINRTNLLDDDLASTSVQPLINVDMKVLNKTKKLDGNHVTNYKEFIFDTSFSTLDVVLNPETISEIILLLHSVYLNLSSNYGNKSQSQFNNSFSESCCNEDFFLEEESSFLLSTSNNSSRNHTEQSCKVTAIETKKKSSQSNPNKMNSKINFKFNRLSVLMFRIEDQDLGKARKIALFDLNGVSISAIILSEENYLNVISNFDALNITDLKESEHIGSSKKSNIVFGIGLEENESNKKAFEIVYNQKSNAQKELLVQTGSVCYLHSSKLIHDIECCMKDFMRFHAKIMEELTENATVLAMRMLKKGQNYLENTIADLYQQNKDDHLISASKKDQRILLTPVDDLKETQQAPLIKIKVLFKTPVIVIPKSLNSKNLLVAHLGHIKITNAASGEELQRADSNSGRKVSKAFSNTPLKLKKKISDSTKFSIFLFDTTLFLIDSEVEHDHLKKNITSTLSTNNMIKTPSTSSLFQLKQHQTAEQTIQTNLIKKYFKIFYFPNYAEKLIEKTNIIVNLDYLPKFNNESTSRNVNIDGAYLHITSKISNTCKINLSKAQMEQLIETIDNLIYKDEKSSNNTGNTVNRQIASNSRIINNSFETIPSLNGFFQSRKARTDKKLKFINEQLRLKQSVENYEELSPSSSSEDDEINFSIPSSLVNSSPATGVLYSAKKAKDKLEFNMNVSFAIEKLVINFLADVEHPNQEIAELCLNVFKLTMNKSQKHITNVEMSLMSLDLFDKLIKVSNDKTKQNFDYHLLTSTNMSDRLTECTCKNADSYLKTKYLSNSLPNLNNLVNYKYNLVNQNVNRKKKVTQKIKQKRNSELINNFYKLTKFYENLNGSLSTSLPSELQNFSLNSGNNNIDTVPRQHECPSTPPPSPTLNTNPAFLNRSESTSELLQDEENNQSRDFLNDQDITEVDMTEEGMNANETQYETECQYCQNLNKPLVNITIDLVDEKHAEFSSTYKKLHKFLMIKFSYLQLNVNAETWIILLDLLGFGAKVYPLTVNKEKEIEKEDDYEDEILSLSLLEEKEKKKNTGVDFEVKHFSIQLNQEGASENNKLAKFSIDNLTTFIETRGDFLKANGKLGSLSIFDMSDYKGLYFDRFLTSGKQALIFEFFKYLGPADLIRSLYEYDSSFKLKMNTVKYVHTQRFIIRLANYFQQFNQLQDALGRMKAISTSKNNVSLQQSRSSRIKLDISTGAPIVVVPVNYKSKKCLVFNLGSIKIKNKFLISSSPEGTIASRLSNKDNLSNDDDDDEKFDTNTSSGSKIDFSLSQSITTDDETENDCLLDAMKIQFSDTHIYSAIRYEKGEKDDSKQMVKEEKVEFRTFLFKQSSNIIMQQKKNFFIYLERNLENELSHKSPDWSMYAKLTSVLFQLDLDQYKLIRGLLDQNIGEPIVQKNLSSFTVMSTTNAQLETVLSGRVWKNICIHLDLKNVGIELLDKIDPKNVNLNTPFAYLGFESSSLVYESNSDGSKLTDLVSNEILITDKRVISKESDFAQSNKFKNILYKKPSTNPAVNSSNRLVLEVHYRSNKQANRYSILINNCRVITILDWLSALKNFIASNEENTLTNEIIELESDSTSNLESKQQPIEVKLNLTETDFVLVENISSANSQAIVLRITAFLEYNQRKLNRPFHSCLQSVEFFSCYMNAINETALTILDPTVLNIFLKSKTSLNDFNLANHKNSEYYLDLSTDLFRIRFSYLDFRLFVKVIDSIKKQLKNISSRNEKAQSNIQDHELKPVEAKEPAKFAYKDINIGVSNLCLYIIDDCKDIDIPLVNVQFNRFKLIHTINNSDVSEDYAIDKNNTIELIPRSQSVRTLSNGSVEFALNIEYYNRLLSGWEPICEPWLSRFNWKFKTNANYFTITSMDVLNLNITNPFIDLMSGVVANWKEDFYNKKTSTSQGKRNKYFQPYKLINLTGQPLKFCCFQNTTNSSLSLTNASDDLVACSEWYKVEDKCEKNFNFFAQQKKQSFRQSIRNNNSGLFENTYQNPNSYRTHNSLLKALVKNRIKISLDDWSEINPLTVDKVGTYFRDMNRIVKANSDITSTQLPNTACLIFEISLSGNATKTIEIKSPVSIKNCLNYKLQCRIESSIQSIMRRIGALIIEIDKYQEVSVPIKYLPCNLWFRPLELDVNKEAEFSDTFINCQEINQPGQIEYSQISCKLSSIMEDTASELVYFFAKIKRLNFPKEFQANEFNQSQVPGHLITIEPAFTLLNLLPVEFRYSFFNTKLRQQQQNGKIDSYKIKSFRNIDVSKQIDLLFDLDSLRMSKTLEINPSKHLNNYAQSSNSTDSSASSSLNVSLVNDDKLNANTLAAPNTNSLTSNKNPATNLSNKKLTILRRINFLDENNRSLFLIAKIIFKIGSSASFSLDSNKMFSSCPIVVQISSTYCFFNLTGLPLVFRQYGCEEASGQTSDHEVACSNQPLLFSFNEVDSPYACSMRIGKQCNDFNAYLYRKNNKMLNQANSESYFIPKWCKPFGLDSGSSYRPLHVVNNIGDSLDDANDEKSSESSYSYLHPDLVYYIGIEIKPGKGLLKETTFVYFSTRYYLVNKSNKDMLISQYHFVEKLREKLANDMSWNNKDKKLSDEEIIQEEKKNSFLLVKGSIIQFHWPRSDFDQLLSVKLKDDANYNNWSGGFKIDNVNSFYVTFRNNQMNSDLLFYIKIEIFLDNGTFYIVFSDTIDFPFPIRIENNSEVSVYIMQLTETAIDEKQSINVKAGQILNYSWDDPIMEKKLLIGVRGGTKDILDFTNLASLPGSTTTQEQTKHLYYESFFYIAFVNPIADVNIDSNNEANTGRIKLKVANSIGAEFLDDSQLVITVRNNQIFTAKKELGNRAQLWHMTVDGLIVHEGSSPPRELGHNSMFDLSNRYVLDIEDMAPRPNHLIPLTLRLPDSRRKNTQKWTFTSDGYLCCKVPNMFLQINEFKVNAKIFLGPMISKNDTNRNSIQLVKQQKVRPGSGHLLVKTLIDGPTKVLNITNIKERSYLSINWQKSIFEPEETETAKKSNLKTSKNSGKSTFEIYINLTGGIGISLIHWYNQEYEELCYAYLKSLEVNFEQNKNEQKLLLSIQSIQVCNQLINSFKQNLLLVQPQQSNTASASSSSNFKDPLLLQSSAIQKQPVLYIDFLRKFRHEGIFTIEHLIVTLSDAIVQIEEKLLWKIIQFLGIVKTSESSVAEFNMAEEKFKIYNENKNKMNEESLSSAVDSIIFTSAYMSSSIVNNTNNFYKTQINSLINNTQSTKYSFNRFEINSIGITLSVYKTSKLSNDLQKIKTTLGIPLIQFENARIECKPFILLNEYDTVMCVLNLISKHYTQELRSHAIRILGSVDFLGNPLGLMVDFKESFTNVISNGQVTDFVFSITHGVANSVSKFSGSLSDELNELTLDERHQETREQIRSIYNNGSIDHFVGGALGFAVGVIGGALSIATQTYRGFNENGVGGAFTGLGRGAVGTVSKPIVGMLDFATGIASAIRETSKGIYKMEIPRIRETRCCAMSGALLNSFSRSDSNGQKILYQINSSNMSEKYIAIEQLNTSPEARFCLVTNYRMIFIKSSELEFKMLCEITYKELKSTRIIQDEQDTRLIIMEICIENEAGVRKYPKFKFETKESAISLENKISYAKANYDESFYNLPNYRDDS